MVLAMARQTLNELGTTAGQTQMVRVGGQLRPVRGLRGAEGRGGEGKGGEGRGGEGRGGGRRGEGRGGEGRGGAG